MDDKKIELPNVESVVVLNIPCWGAGVRPWELGTETKNTGRVGPKYALSKVCTTIDSLLFISGYEHKLFPSPSVCDGYLEVFCVYSSFHIAQMQVRK